MTGAVGSLPALTRLYLGAKHAVCTWPGLRVWPGAREGWPALAPLVTKAHPGPPPGPGHQELFMGWVLGVTGWPCPYLLTSLFTCKTKVKAQGFLTFGKKGMSVSYKTMPGT